MLWSVVLRLNLRPNFHWYPFLVQKNMMENQVTSSTRHAGSNPRLLRGARMGCAKCGKYFHGVYSSQVGWSYIDHLNAFLAACLNLVSQWENNNHCFTKGSKKWPSFSTVNRMSPPLHTKCYPTSQIGEFQCWQGQLKLLSPGFEPQDRDSWGNPTTTTAVKHSSDLPVGGFSRFSSTKVGCLVETYQAIMCYLAFWKMVPDFFWEVHSRNLI